MEKLFLAEPRGEVEAESLLPELGPQVELWTERFIADNGGASTHSLDRDDGHRAVLYEHLHLVLEFLGVIKIGCDSHRQVIIRRDHSLTGFNPPV